MTLASHPKLLEPTVAPTPPPEVSQRVFLPPAAELRRLMPLPPRPRSAAPRPPQAVPAPAPTPPPSDRQKDRISVGASSDERNKPLVMRKDQSLLEAKGRPNAGPSAPPPVSAPPTLPPSAPTQEAKAGGPKDTKSAPGFRLPPGLGDMPRGADGSLEGARKEPSIASSLANLDRRLQENGQRGLPSGTSTGMGSFHFDPEGADFTAWLDHLRIEVYNSWLVPKPAELGYHGHVDITFTCERDGTISSVTVVKGSGTPAFDRAARNALLGSRPLPLPADYRPQQLTIEVSFFYNEQPAGS